QCQRRGTGVWLDGGRRGVGVGAKRDDRPRTAKGLIGGPVGSAGQVVAGDRFEAKNNAAGLDVAGTQAEPVAQVEGRARCSGGIVVASMVFKPLRKRLASG